MRKPIGFWWRTLAQLGIVTRSVSEDPSSRRRRRSFRQRTAQLESLERRELLASVSVYASVSEISESSPGSPVTFTFQANETLENSVTVYFTTSGDAADGTDYTKYGGGSVSGSIMIPGGSSSATISVVPVDDSEVEGSESFTLQLSASGYDLGYSSSATITIADNDVAPPASVSVTVSPSTISESNTAAPAVFTFTRSGNSSSSMALYYFMTGSATEGTDYSISGTAVIPANSNSATISVYPIDDNCRKMLACGMPQSYILSPHRYLFSHLTQGSEYAKRS